MQLEIDAAHTDERTGVLFDRDAKRLILISCNDADFMSLKIMQAVNLYEPLVAALAPFRSCEMGKLLIDTIDNVIVQTKVRRLIDAVDDLLRGVDLVEANEANKYQKDDLGDDQMMA